MPDHHGDPFDRILVAQAQIENLVLVSGDEQVARYRPRSLTPLLPLRISPVSRKELIRSLRVLGFRVVYNAV